MCDTTNKQQNTIIPHTKRHTYYNIIYYLIITKTKTNKITKGRAWCLSNLSDLIDVDYFLEEYLSILMEGPMIVGTLAVVEMGAVATEVIELLSSSPCKVLLSPRPRRLLR